MQNDLIKVIFVNVFLDPYVAEGSHGYFLYHMRAVHNYPIPKQVYFIV